MTCRSSRCSHLSVSLKWFSKTGMFFKNLERNEAFNWMRRLLMRGSEMQQLRVVIAFIWFHEVLKNRHKSEKQRNTLQFACSFEGKRLQSYRIKWLSVCGGCLGDYRRWRTWQPAKSCGELANKLWSTGLRMRKLTCFTGIHNWIHRLWRRTRWTETSK